MENLLHVIALIILLILTFPMLNVFVNVILSIFTNKKVQILNANADFGIIITAYKNFLVTIPSIHALVKQNYPNNKYHVYVVADECSDVEIIEEQNITVLVPERSLSSKVESIRYAIDNFMRQHEYVIVLDADNLSTPNYLLKMNEMVNLGYKVVQGKRTFKNLDTLYSRLDAASEIYYNCTQRTVPFSFGSSAAIAGSAMAIKYELIQKFLSQVGNANKVIIAEDKMLQNFVVSENIQIAFAEDAVVYDEKISDGYQTQRQRTRWLNSYFKNMKSAAAIVLNGLGKMSFNQIYFGVMTAYPPIITLILSSVVVSSIAAVINFTIVWAIIIGWFLFIANFFLVLILNKAKREIVLSLIYIPLFAFRQIIALLNLKKSNNDFMATEHTKILSLNEVLEGKIK